MRTIRGVFGLVELSLIGLWHVTDAGAGLVAEYRAEVRSGHRTVAGDVRRLLWHPAWRRIRRRRKS